MELDASDQTMIMARQIKLLFWHAEFDATDQPKAGVQAYYITLEITLHWKLHCTRGDDFQIFCMHWLS
jgi:hypothetical protein